MDVRSLPIYKPVMSETEAASADGALKDLYKAVDKAHKALVMSPWGIVPDSEEATNLKKIGYPGPWTDKGSDMAKDLAKIGVLGPWETWGKKWEDIKSKTTAAIDKEADALKKQGLFGGDKEQAKDLIKAGLIPGPWGGKGWGGYGGLEKMGFPGPFGKVRSGGCCRCYTCMVIDTYAYVTLWRLVSIALQAVCLQNPNSFIHKYVSLLTIHFKLTLTLPSRTHAHPLYLHAHTRTHAHPLYLLTRPHTHARNLLHTGHALPRGPRAQPVPVCALQQNEGRQQGAVGLGRRAVRGGCTSDDGRRATDDGGQRDDAGWAGAAVWCGTDDGAGGSRKGGVGLCEACAGER